MTDRQRLQAPGQEDTCSQQDHTVSQMTPMSQTWPRRGVGDVHTRCFPNFPTMTPWRVGFPNSRHLGLHRPAFVFQRDLWGLSTQPEASQRARDQEE